MTGEFQDKSLYKWIMRIFMKCTEVGNILEDLKNVRIVPCYRCKYDKNVCAN